MEQKKLTTTVSLWCQIKFHFTLSEISFKVSMYRPARVCVLIAVRFGRVPKREKAKILEQMQRVNVQCQGSLVDTIVADEVYEYASPGCCYLW